MVSRGKRLFCLLIIVLSGLFLFSAKGWAQTKIRFGQPGVTTVHAPFWVAIEAGCEMGWSKYIGDNGVFVGINRFGVSAPYKTCYEKFGLTAAAVVEAAKKTLKN